MKTEWRKIALGEILDYEQPTKYIVESTDYKDEYETPVLTAGKSFLLGYTNETKGIYENPPVIIFDDFTTSSQYVDFKFKVKSSAMKLLTPKNDLINIKFVFLAMQRLRFDITRHKRYYLSAYQNLKIPMPFNDGKPDIEKQKQIVAIIEKAEDLKNKREKASELANEYLKAVFNEMFLKGDFERVELGSVCEINPKKSEISNFDDDLKISFLGMTDIGEKGEIYREESKKLVDVIKGFTYFKKGDVLFAKITPCMENGKGAIARIKNNIGFGSTEFHVLRPNKKINNQFIYFLLSLKNIRKFAESNMTGSAGQKRVPKSFLEQLKIPLPSIELQEKFASIVKEIEKLKEQQKNSKENIDELFDSLVKKAFAGELI
jgi:type I restriction enzyme, S subunit